MTELRGSQHLAMTELRETIEQVSMQQESVLASRVKMETTIQITGKPTENETILLEDLAAVH